LFFGKLPNPLSIESSVFNVAKYKEKGDTIESQQDGRQTIKLAENTIRWRWTIDAQGNRVVHPPSSYNPLF
jgi:hypothetical protein